MSLTDLMSGADLDGYAQVSLILFIFAFVLIVWRIFSKRFRDEHARDAMMPLDDEHPQTPRSPGE